MIDGQIREVFKVDKKNESEVKNVILRDIENYTRSNWSVAEDKEKEKDKSVLRGETREELINNELRRRSFAWSLLLLVTFPLFYLMYWIRYLLKRMMHKANGFKKFLNGGLILIHKMSNILFPNEKIAKGVDMIDIVELAAQNLAVKKSRTTITIFGMGVGIGLIVFLLSIGYGLQNIVLDSITEINNRKHLEVTPSIASNITLNDETKSSISNIPGVDTIFPIISVAAKVNIEGSEIDVVSYGVQSDYLLNSNSKLTNGRYFDNNDLFTTVSSTSTEFLQGVNNDDLLYEIIVNETFVDSLGLGYNEIIEKEILLSFVTTNIRESTEEEYETDPVKYKIVGVIKEDTVPLIYLPIVNVKSLGIDEYSQARVVMSFQEESEVETIRKSIESLGLDTRSVLDTISQVDDLFQAIRVSLVVVGSIALIIAILGVINTLTVSLLERTREVGLMKALGMQSYEIRSLLISESMIIGYTGGIVGIIFGSFLGILLSIIVSVIMLSNGGEFVWVTNIPLSIIVALLFVSLVVSFITGLYPSKRAIEMSPMDALRYE